MYKLTQFGSVVLPVASPKHTAGTFTSQQRLVNVLGGVYDAGGTEQDMPALPFELVYECKIKGNTSIGLRTRMDQLRSLRGKVDRLYRETLDDLNVRHWALARLVEIQYQTEAQHSHGVFQPLSMIFNVKTRWRGSLHGPPWYLNTGRFLDTGLYLDMVDRYALTTIPRTLTITNAGNAPVDDVLLTLEAGATPVTGLTITVGACQLVWSGTVAAGTSLVINCSPMVMSVLNDGVAAWSSLALGAGHASPVWLRLAVGANSMVVTRTGGGADTYLTLDFSDGWE